MEPDEPIPGEDTEAGIPEKLWHLVIERANKRIRREIERIEDGSKTVATP